MHDRVFDPSQVHKLEAKERLQWLPPSEILGWLELRPGMIVADIGAGTGYFAIPIAQAIAPSGHVFAVDLQPELLVILRSKLAKPGAPANIVPLEGPASSTGLADGSCDKALLANVWHELDDHAAALAELARILKPGGRIAVWTGARTSSILLVPRWNTVCPRAKCSNSSWTTANEWTGRATWVSTAT